jgi:uncharacterized protein
MLRAFAALATFWLLVVALPSLALDVPPYDSPVTDLADVLSESAREALNRKILDYRSQSGNEIGVLIIPSLEGDAIEDFAHTVFRTWGVGNKETKKGVLFVMAVKDRKARVEVGYGLEAELTDSEAGRLVRRDSPMAGYFRQGDWDRGVTAVVDGMIAAIGGEYNPQGNESTKTVRGLPFGFVAILVIIGMIIIICIARFSNRGAKSGGKGSSFVLGALLGALLSNRRGGKHDDWHWGGGFGGGGGGGGGGGFSFGGGSSGGGGASGGW